MPPARNVPPCWFETLRSARTPAHRRAWLLTAAMCGAFLLAQGVLAALIRPAPLPFGLCAGLAGTLWISAGLPLVYALAPRAPWTGPVHYAARIVLLVFSMTALWACLAGAEGVSEELSPYGLGILLWCCALFPVARVLREAAAIHPRRAGGLLRWARRLRHLQTALFALAAAVVVTGLFVEMRKDYPVDPTVILALLWSVALASAIVAAAQAIAPPSPDAPPAAPRPLDDPPPPPSNDAPSSPPPRFAPDDW